MLVVKIAEQANGAGRAIAFAAEIDGRRPALQPRKIQPYKISDRLNVGLHIVELLVVFIICRSAVACAHGVDKHKVGKGKP